MIFWVRMNQEWSYCAMSGGGAQVLQRAEGVVAGQARVRQPPAERVEPHRRRAGQDADAVVGPDRVPVLHALGVVPHPVPVDQAHAGVGGDVEHPTVDVGGHAGDHATWAAVPSRSGQYRRTMSWLAPMPPVVTMTACAVSSNSPTALAVGRDAAGRVVGSQHGAAHPGDGAVGDRRARRPGAGGRRCTRPRFVGC